MYLPEIIIIFRIWQCFSKRSIFQNEVHQACHQTRLRLLQHVSCEVWERRILGHLFDSGGAVVTKEVVAAVHAEACVHVLNDQMILGSEKIQFDLSTYLEVRQIIYSLTWLSVR